jgi:hypothetical protein
LKEQEEEKAGPEKSLRSLSKTAPKLKRDRWKKDQWSSNDEEEEGEMEKKIKLVKKRERSKESSLETSRSRFKSEKITESYVNKSLSKAYRSKYDFIDVPIYCEFVRNNIIFRVRIEEASFKVNDCK